MDDIFEVLIYLLFIGASVVGGIYKNYAKKKEEEKRQRQINNTPKSTPQEEVFEPMPESSIPQSIEDFLKQQFEIDQEKTTVENTELIQDNVEDEPPLDVIEKDEGVAAFKNTNDTLLSDNLHESEFTISSELEKAKDSIEISEEEINAFSINAMDDDEPFDLKQAVIYSEILKRPYA